MPIKRGSNDISDVKLGASSLSSILNRGSELLSATSEPILDTYSGAGAAYSVRLLSSSYSGSSMRVRRASDDAEQDIGFSAGELDITSLESFCSGTNGFVSIWYDQSGNGADADREILADQPQIVSSGNVITEGTKPAISFDGAGDSLLYSSGIIPSIFVLVHNSGISDEIIRFSGGEIFRSPVAPGFIEYTTINGTLTSDASGYSVSTLDNLNSELYVRGILEASGASLRQVFNRIDLKGSGTMQEFILYPSATDRAAYREPLESSANEYYGIY